MRSVIFFLLFFILCLDFVYADSIVGVSPGSVDFKNVLRGGYAERYLTLTISGADDDVIVSAKPRGEISSWLNYSENFTISSNGQGRMFLSVRPPNDIPNGNYTGFLRISTGALGSVPSGQAVNAVRAVLDVAITVEITDQEIQSCSARGFNVFSAEKGEDVIFELSIYNQGNVRLDPLSVLEIWDQDQISLVDVMEFRADDVLPTREQIVQFRMSTNDIEIGQYWVNVKVPDCFSEGLLTFDVLEPGALRSEGVLNRVYTVPWWKVGETFPIFAEFENTGEKAVDAKFKGQISLDGRIERVLESEVVSVPIGKVENFTFFFTPNKPGSYVASGRVFYDKKRTFETSGVFNVAPVTFSFKNIILVLIYLVLIVAIAFLLYKVHGERKKYTWKLKSLRHGGYYILTFFVILFFVSQVSASSATFFLPITSNSSEAVFNEILRSSGIVFQVNTDRPSVCKYSIHKGVSFANMEGNFDFNFETVHKKDLTGLGDGAYKYFVKCKDDFGNESGELEANFAVSLPASAKIILESGEVIGNERTEVLVKTSKALSQAPLLSYSFDGINYDPVPLFGADKEWRGYLTVSQSGKELIGSFKFQGRDLEGVIGSDISEGGTFFVDTKKPDVISDIKSDGYEGEIKISWNSDGDDAEQYKIYKSTEPGVDYSDYLKTVDEDYFTDTSVERGKTYYYRIAGVDSAGNTADLSKEVYATALLENLTVRSGLELRYVGLVDNFLSEIDDLTSLIDELSRDLANRDGTEGDLYSSLKFERDVNGAKSELQSLRREAENYKSQSLSKSELDQKLNSGKLKISTIKRKIPENIIVVSEKSQKNSVGEEDVASAVLRIWPDISDTLKEKRAQSSIGLMESEGFKVNSEAYNVEVVFMDGTRRELAVVRQLVQFNQKRNDSVYILEVVPEEIARGVSELSVKNSDYEVIKEDTIVSFSADTKEILYTLDKHIDLDALSNVKTFVIYEVSEEVKQKVALSGYFSFVSLDNGGDYLGIVFAVIVLCGLWGYLFYMRRTGEVSEKLISIRQIIEDAEKSLIGGRKEVAKDFYHAASLHYRNLEKKLQKAIYFELETLHKKISGGYNGV